MGDLVLYTYDWVPPPPRGHVRDVRVRWALEEAKLPFRVQKRDWLAGAFSVADILMADVLSLVDRFEGPRVHQSARRSAGALRQS